MPIVFQEDTEFTRPQALASERPPLMIRIALSTKLVSTKAEAEYLLLGFALFAVVLAVGIYIFANTPPLPAQTPSSFSWPHPIAPIYRP